MLISLECDFSQMQKMPAGIEAAGPERMSLAG